MGSLPEFNRDGGIDDAKSKARNLCPWLPDPHQCDDCGALCEASQSFDPVQAMVVDSWECGNCGSEYYRERY